MSKDKKAVFNNLRAWLFVFLTVGALAVLIWTAITLASIANPPTAFVRASVWRIFSCGCIILIFPYLLFRQIGPQKTAKEEDKND